MLIPPMVGQEGGGFDIIWILLPLLCCVMMMSQRGERPQAHEAATESWYTTQDIGAAYSAIEAETGEWREEAAARQKEKSGSLTSRIKGVIGGGREQERYAVRETSPPKLYRMDDASGPIYFELTEVEGGGTVVKATYNSAIKSRMAKFKAKMPLKIPATPIGNRCPSCGKPVLREFKMCPYCGEQLITE